jgi:hypothetical protein
MDDIIFKDDEHKNKYESYISRVYDSFSKDPCTIGLLYLLALIPENPEKFFDFNRCSITPENVSDSFWTCRSGKTVRLAYILWEGAYLYGNPKLIDISKIFGGSDDIYYLEALKLRFKIYEDKE